MIRHPRLCAALLALAAITAAPAGYAACTYPHAPSAFPDGNTATLQEMVEAKRGVDSFMADMNAYLKCVDEENPPAPAGTPLSDTQKKEQDARERMREKKHNAGVTDMEGVAERMNAQIKVFKEKNAATKK